MVTKNVDPQNVHSQKMAHSHYLYRTAITRNSMIIQAYKTQPFKSKGACIRRG